MNTTDTGKNAPQTDAERQRIERLRSRSQAARRMAREFKQRDKEAFANLNELLLASRLNDVLEDFDPGVLTRLIDDKPEHFFRLASAINAPAAERLRREKLEFEFDKYRDTVHEQKRQIEQATRKAETGGLSPEILAQIEQAANLL